MELTIKLESLCIDIDRISRRIKEINSLISKYSGVEEMREERRKLIEENVRLHQQRKDLLYTKSLWENFL